MVPGLPAPQAAVPFRLTGKHRCGLAARQRSRRRAALTTQYGKFEEPASSYRVCRRSASTAGLQRRPALFPGTRLSLVRVRLIGEGPDAQPLTARLLLPT